MACPKQKSQGMRKTTDKIGLSTQLGYSTNNVWYYTLMGDLNTQFAKGYNYTGQDSLYFELLCTGLF